MEKRLTYLYALQEIDAQLQEIHDLKGDLPGIVSGLKAQIAEAKAKVKELNDQIKQLKIDRENADSDVITFGEKIEKYKSQQLQVKSNKQYDALSREIDSAEEKITKREKEMELFEGKLKNGKSDVETLTGKIEELSAELDEKEKELREVSREHEKEEAKLKQQRNKLSEKVDKPDLERYERIRKAKGGKAVVAVKRESCGGCFSRIPPQKILELRENSRLYMCEHCGRIVVSDEIVTMSASLT